MPTLYFCRSYSWCKNDQKHTVFYLNLRYPWSKLDVHTLHNAKKLCFLKGNLCVFQRVSKFKSLNRFKIALVHSFPCKKCNKNQWCVMYWVGPAQPIPAQQLSQPSPGHRAQPSGPAIHSQLASKRANQATSPAALPAQPRPASPAQRPSEPPQLASKPANYPARRPIGQSGLASQLCIDLAQPIAAQRSQQAQWSSSSLAAMQANTIHIGFYCREASYLVCMYVCAR